MKRSYHRAANVTVNHSCTSIVYRMLFVAPGDQILVAIPQYASFQLWTILKSCQVRPAVWHYPFGIINRETDKITHLTHVGTDTCRAWKFPCSFRISPYVSEVESVMNTESSNPYTCRYNARDSADSVERLMHVFYLDMTIYSVVCHWYMTSREAGKVRLCGQMPYEPG